MQRTRPLAILLLMLAVPVGWTDIAINGSLFREYIVEPGRAYEGTVELRNQGDTQQEVKIYQTDYLTYADGRALFGDPGLLPRSNARWITFAPAQITVPAREMAVVRFTIQVPDDTALTGSYWSALMIEPIVEGSPESSTTQPGQVGLSILQVIRYSMLIATQVGGTGAVRAQFTDMQLTMDGEKRVLVTDVVNTGDQWYVGHLWVELYGMDGRLVGKFDGDSRRLFPGSGARFPAPLTGVQDASYQALVVLDCGGENVFGANVSIRTSP
jgi:hypothetical protein